MSSPPQGAATVCSAVTVPLRGVKKLRSAAASRTPAIARAKMRASRPVMRETVASDDDHPEERHRRARVERHLGLGDGGGLSEREQRERDAHAQRAVQREEQENPLAPGPAPLGEILHRSEGEEPGQERVKGHVPAHARSLPAEPGRYRLPSSALSHGHCHAAYVHDGRAFARPPDDSRDGGLRVFYTLPGFSMYCMFSSWIR